MNYRLTVGLLIVLLILGGAAYWSETRPQPTPTPTANPIFDFISAEATRLTVQAAGATVVVERDDKGHWQLTQPEAATADDTRVESALSELAYLVPSRTIDAPADLGEFGLVTTTLQLQVDVRGGKSLKLVFGSNTPDGGSSYARLPDGSAVFLVSATTASSFQALVKNPPKATPTPAASPSAGATLRLATPGPTVVGEATPSATPGQTPSPTATAGG